MNTPRINIDNNTPKLNINNAKKLHSRYTKEQKQKLAKATKGFESMLTSLMLKSMQKTSGGMFGDKSLGGDYFSSMFENKISSFIADKKGLGVAKLLYKKITGEELKTAPTVSNLKGINNYNILNLKHNKNNKPVVVPSDTSLNRLNQYVPIINEASKLFNVDKDLIKSVILAESAANGKAISKVKAKGLMQLMDGTAKDLGVNNVWDSKENIFGGTKYLSQLLEQFNGNVNFALAGYNAGPRKVVKSNGIPEIQETKNYINRVLGYLNYFSE